jgi:polar amino acid transport system substrate-binding protein
MKIKITKYVVAISVIILALSAFAMNDDKQTNPASVKNISGDFELKAGYFEFPGLTYTDENGKPAGFVNDITIKTLENAKIKYSISSYPAARFYEYLSTGKIKLFSGLSSIPIVQQSTISSSVKLFPLEMRIYYVGNKAAITKKEELAGRSVILVRGFTYKDWGAWIRDKENKVNFFETDSHEAAFEMLKRGRADYLLNYKHIDTDVLNKIKIPNLIIKPLFKGYCYFNIYKDTPNARQLLKILENSYLQLIREGKIKKYD